MNSNCLLAFTEVMTHDRMRQSCHSVLQWFIADTISTETGTTGSGTVDFFKLWAWVFYRILFLSSMDLAINNVTNLCNFVGKMVCVCVCVQVSVYLELLSHFLPFKIHLTNILPILIKMVDFKNLAWATSLATGASRKFIYLPYRASGKKSYCHTLCTDTHMRMHTHTNTDLSVSPSATAMWYGSNKVCTPSNMLCASWWYLAKSWNKTVHMKGSAHFHLKSCFVSPQNSTKYFMQIFKTQHQASIKYKSLWHLSPWTYIEVIKIGLKV